MARSEFPINTEEVQPPLIYNTRQQPIRITLGHFFFAYRDYLFPLTFLIFLMMTRPAFPFGSERGDWWLDLVGILLCCAGQGCRFLAAGCASNIRRRGFQGKIGAEQLLQTGIFAHVRNPLYVGNLLIVSGFVLVVNNLWWYLVVLPSFGFIYYAIVSAEESYLSKRFGDEYLDYCGRVRRFRLRLHGLWQSLRQCPFDWRRALRREYGNLCSWGTMIFVLLIWERWEHFGYYARAVEINELLIGLLLLIVGYGIVRRSKHRGWLHS